MTQPDPKAKSSLKEYLILILIILVGLPIAWNWGLRDGNALAERAYGKDAKSAVKTESSEEAEDDDEGEGEKAAPESSPEAIARGETLFKANCVACHGEKADGKGPAAVAFTPPPRDFTDPNAKWTQGNTPAQIFATVTGGVPGTGMAGFSGTLDEAQRWDLVHYIGSLPGLKNVKGAGGGNP